MTEVCKVFAECEFDNSSSVLATGNIIFKSDCEEPKIDEKNFYWKMKKDFNLDSNFR